tara:strand:+ start:4569 stop:4748 length:180 start_codon:yes stop_codon:yes gene_type:complete
MIYTIENDVYRKLYNDTAISEVKDFYYSARNYDLTNIKDFNSSSFLRKKRWNTKSTKLN